MKTLFNVALGLLVLISSARADIAPTDVVGTWHYSVNWFNTGWAVNEDRTFSADGTCSGPSDGSTFLCTWSTHHDELDVDFYELGLGDPNGVQSVRYVGRANGQGGFSGRVMTFGGGEGIVSVWQMMPTTN